MRWRRPSTPPAMLARAPWGGEAPLGAAGRWDLSDGEEVCASRKKEGVCVRAPLSRTGVAEEKK